MAVEIATGIRWETISVADSATHPDLVGTLSPLELARPADEDEAAA